MSISNQDKNLFLQHMQSVTPLSKKHISLLDNTPNCPIKSKLKQNKPSSQHSSTHSPTTSKNSSTSPTSSNHLTTNPLCDPNIDSFNNTLEANYHVMSFQRNSVSHKELRRLKAGKVQVTQEIDLHGQTVHEARQRVWEFLKRSHERQCYCIKIIHGKGNNSTSGRIGTLKLHVLFWLKQIDWVLAFSPCIPKDGGTGSVYVLLTKKQPKMR